MWAIPSNDPDFEEADAEAYYAVEEVPEPEPGPEPEPEPGPASSTPPTASVRSSECDEFLRDPEVKDLLNNIEASQTVKRLLADTLRNTSLTIDAATLSIGAAIAASGVGIPVGGAVVKGGGVASAAALIGASALGLMNGDYKVAAIDGAAGILSAVLAGGGGASKTAKSVGTKLLQRGAAKVAQLEAKIATQLVARGASKEAAQVIAKSFIANATSAASSKLRGMIGDIPTQNEGEDDKDYKRRVQQWQQEKSEKVAEIFNKCYEKTEDTKTIKNVKKAIKGFDTLVNFGARKIDQFIDFGVGLVKGGSLNESQLSVARELGLGDMQLLKEEKLVTIHIDFTELKKQELNESFLAMFGGWVEQILGSIFTGRSLPLAVKGNSRDVKAFAKAIGGEKDYIEAARKYGLDHPTTYKNKAKLNNAIRGFEKDTGLKWPFK